MYFYLLLFLLDDIALLLVRADFLARVAKTFWVGAEQAISIEHNKWYGRMFWPGWPKNFPEEVEQAISIENNKIKK